MDNEEYVIPAYEPHTLRLAKLSQDVKHFLDNRLLPHVKYHTTDHTFDPNWGVVATTNDLVSHEGVSDYMGEIAVAAATIHDLGWCFNDGDNEPKGARFGSMLMEIVGFFPEEIKLAELMVLNTDPKINTTLSLKKAAKQYGLQGYDAMLADDDLARAMNCLLDADVYNFGTPYFLEKTERLRRGRAAQGHKDAESPLLWYKGTLKFMKNYGFKTNTARIRLGQRRERNMQWLRDQITQLEDV